MLLSAKCCWAASLCDTESANGHMSQCVRITLNSEVWSYRMPLCTLSKFSSGMGAK